jgi:hypothetical protein
VLPAPNRDIPGPGKAELDPPPMNVEHDEFYAGSDANRFTDPP